MAKEWREGWEREGFEVRTFTFGSPIGTVLAAQLESCGNPYSNAAGRVKRYFEERKAQSARSRERMAQLFW